jgi:hypothetical protein
VRDAGPPRDIAQRQRTYGVLAQGGIDRVEQRASDVSLGHARILPARLLDGVK